MMAGKAMMACEVSGKMAAAGMAAARVRDAMPATVCGAVPAFGARRCTDEEKRHED